MGTNTANFGCAALWVMLLGKSVDACVMLLVFLKMQAPINAVGRK